MGQATFGRDEDALVTRRSGPTRLSGPAGRSRFSGRCTATPGRPAEDLVQDSVEVALRRWPVTGVPDRPDAWLYTVARRRGLDVLRRSSSYASKLSAMEWPEPQAAIGRDHDALLADRRALELTNNPAEKAVLRERLSWS
ncbi:MAG TPA: sigma factor [Acidimicrobiales bacterium]|nr:sigma factor [Acidimicrobiales bacterium]